MYKASAYSRTNILLIYFLLISTACSACLRELNPSGDIANPDIPYSHNPDSSEELRVRSGLPNFFARVGAGDSVCIGFVGGSITNQSGWRDMTFAWLQEQYPTAVMSQVNAAVPGTGADFAACRMERDLLSHQPDLIFVEYRVNGGGGFEARAIEGLVRQIRQSDPETDICLVYTIGHWMLDVLRNGGQTMFGKIMENMANEYGIPSIDLGVEVIKQLKAGDLVFESPDPVEGKLHFSRDGVHPIQEGHALYRDIVARSILKMQDHGTPGVYTIPNPIERYHFSTASLLPITNASYSPGWVAVDAETDAIYKDDSFRTGMMLDGAVKCTTAGETITVNWEGMLICFTTIPQGDGMAAEVSIDGGPPKEYTFKQTSDKRYFARFFYAPEMPSGRHAATLKVTELPEGTSFYCGQFLIIDDPAKLPFEDAGGDLNGVHHKND